MARRIIAELEGNLHIGCPGEWENHIGGHKTGYYGDDTRILGFAAIN
jgi:hypothetical protein